MGSKISSRKKKSKNRQNPTSGRGPTRSLGCNEGEAGGGPASDQFHPTLGSPTLKKGSFFATHRKQLPFHLPGRSTEGGGGPAQRLENLSLLRKGSCNRCEPIHQIKNVDPTSGSRACWTTHEWRPMRHEGVLLRYSGCHCPLPGGAEITQGGKSTF